MRYKSNTKRLYFYLFSLLFLFCVSPVLAATVTDDFDDETLISSYNQLVVSESQVKIDTYYGEPPVGWWNGSWGCARKITADSGDVDEALSDFPVLVYLNSNRIDWGNVQDDLDDLRFISSDNTTEYAYEIERYTINDDAWIWIKVPTVSNTSDTDFFMYYGNAGASSGEDITNVWDSNFVFVSHMQDDPDTSHILDSTSNDNDGTKLGANEPVETVSGKIGDAQDFDGADDYIDLGNDAELRPTDQLTVEAWFNLYNFTDTYFSIVSPTDYHFDLQIKRAVAKIRTRALVYTTAYQVMDGTIDYNLDTDYFYALTFNKDLGSNQLKSYIDGGLEKQKDGVTDPISYVGTPSIRIATRTAFDGIIDEVRISNVSRSAAWIKASYETQNDDLLSFGSEEDLGDVYYTDGILYSSNLLQSINVTDIESFSYESDIVGSEQIDFQFSQDNTTWYNSTSLESWEIGLNGVNTVNLGVLSWDGGFFYYRSNFTAGSTPELESITLTYSISTVQSYFLASFLVLAFIIVPVIAFVKKKW